jgi:hypothetical protein
MKGKKAIYVLLVLLAAGVEIGTAANDNIEVSKVIGYAFFALALILAAFAFGYALFFIRRLKKRRKGEEEKDRVEEVIKILKETKRIKEEIKRRGENLTSESDITQAQILFGINDLKSSLLSGISDLKTLLMFAMSLILFGIGITLAFGIAIITML